MTKGERTRKALLDAAINRFARDGYEYLLSVGARVTYQEYPIGHTITGKYWLDLHEDDLHWNLSKMGWANSQN